MLLTAEVQRDDAFLAASRRTPVDMQSWVASLPRGTVIAMKDPSLQRSFEQHLDIDNMKIPKLDSYSSTQNYLQHLLRLMSIDPAHIPPDPRPPEKLCQECEQRLKSNAEILSSFEVTDDRFRRSQSERSGCALCLLLADCIVEQENVTLKLSQVNSKC